MQTNSAHDFVFETWRPNLCTLGDFLQTSPIETVQELLRREPANNSRMIGDEDDLRMKMLVHACHMQGADADEFECDGVDLEAEPYKNFRVDWTTTSRLGKPRSRPGTPARSMPSRPLRSRHTTCCWSASPTWQMRVKSCPNGWSSRRLCCSSERPARFSLPLQIAYLTPHRRHGIMSVVEYCIPTDPQTSHSRLLVYTC